MIVKPPLTSTTGFTISHGGVAITGGTASLSGTTDGFYPAAYTSQPMYTDDFYTEMVLSGTIGAPNSGAQTRIAGPGVRCNAGFTQGVYASVDTSGIYIQTDTSGAGTPTTRASLAVTPAVGDKIRIAAAGNVFTVYRNGIFAVSWIDSGGLTAKGPTLRLGSFIVSRAVLSNSASLTTMVISDIVYGKRNNFVPMQRSSLR